MPGRDGPLLGRFHEIGIDTTDIRASIEFYERLGFTQAATTDAWSHPYGVVTDGRLVIGLHQGRNSSPHSAPAHGPLSASTSAPTPSRFTSTSAPPAPHFSLTFVLPGIATRQAELEHLGIELTVCRTGEEVFNEIGFRDPFGQSVVGLEARTYSPVDRTPEAVSLCGYFAELSLPAHDFEAARAFWEPLGFVSTGELETPYPHLQLTSDHLDIAFHRPRTFDAPLLVFREPDMPQRVGRLRELGIPMFPELPRGVPDKRNAIVQSPEGTLLLLLEAES